MKAFRLLWPALALLLVACHLQHLHAAAPKVIKTVPTHGERAVDPGLSELRVVFDQPMASNGWSVVGGGPNFPKLVGKARWKNDRTFVWSWRLEPDHEYWLSINNRRFRNFRSAEGVPAQPHQIAFHTATLPPDSDLAARRSQLNQEAAVYLREAIDEDYSYRDLHNVDWTARFAQFTPQLVRADDPRTFANIAAELLGPAADIHLWLQVGQDQVYTHTRRAQWNIALNRLPALIPDWTRHNAVVATGLFPGQIRYLLIRNWPSQTELLEPALEAVREAARQGRPMIIDVRANGGGSELSAAKVAGWFVADPVTYARSLTRHNGSWHGPLDRVLTPTPPGPAFRGRVAVLMGAGTVSSSEGFVLMMKQAAHSALLGSHTAGCSGNPKPVDLGNGVEAFIPSWKSLRLDGTCLEGEGVAPDIRVEFSPDVEGDPVLNAALDWLRETDERQ